MGELFGVWLERGAWHPGETVRGKVVFPPPDPQTAEKVLEQLAKVSQVKLWVGAEVTGSGNHEKVVALDEVVHKGAVRAPLELPFTAALPAKVPCSWQGRYVKVQWTIEVELDIPWALDPKKRLAFEVVPKPAP